MKRFIAILGFILFASLACTKTPQWQMGEWKGSGKMALPLSFVAEPNPVRFQKQSIEFSYQQVAGVSVEGAFAKAVYTHQEGLGSFRYIESQALPHVTRVQDAKVNKENVIRAARKKRVQILDCQHPLDSFDNIQPVIHWDVSQWVVAYRGVCESAQGQPFEYWLSSTGSLLDARTTGAQLSSANDVIDVFIDLYPKGPKDSILRSTRVTVSATPNYLFNGVLDAVSDSGVKIQDLTRVSDIKPNDLSFDLLQVYYFTSQASNWVARQFNFQPQPLKVRTHVGYPERTNATFYFNREVRLGVGDDKAFSKISWDPSIVIHEFMHSVVDTLTRLPFQGEGGSLNEGICDAVTAIYLDNPRIGESSYQKGPFQRTLESHLEYSSKKGALYADSLIFSSSIWALKQKIGDRQTLTLISYLLQSLTPGSNFEEVRELMSKWTQEQLDSDSRVLAVQVLKDRGWL